MPHLHFPVLTTRNEILFLFDRTYIFHFWPLVQILGRGPTIGSPWSSSTPSSLWKDHHHQEQNLTFVNSKVLKFQVLKLKFYPCILSKLSILIFINFIYRVTLKTQKYFYTVFRPVPDVKPECVNAALSAASVCIDCCKCVG